MRGSLFDGWRASLLTIAALTLLALFLPPLLRFLIFDAVWVAPDGEACRAPGAGACWAFVARKLPYFTYGSYPITRALARRASCLALGAVLIVWLLRAWRAAPGDRRRILFFGVYPIVSFRPASGLRRRSACRASITELWGGMLVSLVVASSASSSRCRSASCWRSGAAIRCRRLGVAARGFIEIVRGVPMITVLFMADTMLPLFLPENWRRTVCARR